MDFETSRFLVFNRGIGLSIVLNSQDIFQAYFFNGVRGLYLLLVLPQTLVFSPKLSTRGKEGALLPVNLNLLVYQFDLKSLASAWWSPVSIRNVLVINPWILVFKIWWGQPCRGIQIKHRYSPWFTLGKNKNVFSEDTRKRFGRIWHSHANRFKRTTEYFMLVHISRIWSAFDKFYYDCVTVNSLNVVWQRWHN